MIEPPTAAPSLTPQAPPVVTWKLWHTGIVVAVVLLLIYLAFWPPAWRLWTFWVLGMVTLVAFTLVVGHGVTGVWKGAFVDERLKMSLSRFQTLAWTVVILSALGTMAIARAASHAVSAMDIQVPATIWTLLGISVTSLVGSPFIKNAKRKEPEPEHAAVTAQGQTVRGPIVSNRSIEDATIADMFRGENVDDFALLDMAKIQMFLFTLILVLAYAFAIAEVLASSDLSRLPDVGAGMLPLLGISHAGYLVSKVVSTPAGASQPASPPPTV